MAIRMVEFIVPVDLADTVHEVLAGHFPDGPWHQSRDDGELHVRLLVDADHTREIVDLVEGRFGQEAGFRLLLLPVEAAIPALDESEAELDRGEQQPPAPDGPLRDAQQPPPARIASIGLSRQELAERIKGMARPSRVFVVLTVLSTVVATIGLLRDNVPVIIGAMVIAPLLGPNVSAAFATTVGDSTLLRRSLITNLIGFLVALWLSIVMCLIVTVDPASPELALRCEVGLSDVLLALASGCAGALAISSGVASALVGVMVAVALLPPTATLGLMLGSGHWTHAMGAGLLLATNVICVNLAAVSTFLAQGIKPRTWWETQRVKRSARMAITIWTFLLLVLVALIVLGQSTPHGD